MDLLTANAATSDCEGEWKSKIKGVDEGRFYDLKVDGSGNITGKFEDLSLKSKEIISGSCKKEGETHRLTLSRDDDDNTYDYTGLITDEGGGIFTVRPGDGTRSTSPKPRPLGANYEEEKTDGKAPFDAPEDWVAEKGT